MKYCINAKSGYFIECITGNGRVWGFWQGGFSSKNDTTKNLLSETLSTIAVASSVKEETKRQISAAIW